MTSPRARSRGVWIATGAGVVTLAAIVVGTAAAAAPGGPVLHEPIPPNPGEDLAMHVVLEGNLPAAIQTTKGALAAPDPQALPAESDVAYGAGTEHDRFQADRDTRRPDVSGYDDPFTPATAPFKRLAAFDAVRADYTLYVRDPRGVALPTNAAQTSEEDAFFADAVVDLAPDQRARIPSVGPGARIARARLGVGARDVPLRVLRDGADNWFLEATGLKAPTRARLVMELVIPRAAFADAVGDPSWDELPIVAPLPDNVARDAAVVAAAVGTSRQMRPRQAIALLVRYFRGFTDSSELPPGRGNVYLDLALSKKGVCRHRAFAFLVTAESLGIPTRMVLNEAHAWVEIHDGTLWRRIDLGGAGRWMDGANPRGHRVAYEAPADALPWPAEADRGEGAPQDAHAQEAPAPSSEPGSNATMPTRSASTPSSAGSTAVTEEEASGADDPALARPASSVTVGLIDADAHRGRPLRMRGAVHADGQPCPHVAVDLSLRDETSARRVFLGTLATGDDGDFAGAIVVPSSIPLGDYDLVAHTTGDARCGASTN